MNWRLTAWCHEHEKLQQIWSVKQTRKAYRNECMLTNGQLCCGHPYSIVASYQNLKAIKESVRIDAARS